MLIINLTLIFEWNRTYLELLGGAYYKQVTKHPLSPEKSQKLNRP
jgi:hypothetical protein